MRVLFRGQRRSRTVTLLDGLWNELSYNRHRASGRFYLADIRLQAEGGSAERGAAVGNSTDPRRRGEPRNDGRRPGFRRPG